MNDRLTVVVHDWSGGEQSDGLLQFLSKVPGADSLEIVVVLPEKGAASGDLPPGVTPVAAGNRSSGGARKNAGLQACRGDALLLSEHARPRPADFIERLSSLATAMPGLGAAGCTRVDPAGTVVDSGAHVLFPDCDLYRVEGGKRDMNQYHYAREVHGVDSGCMYVTRRAFESAGGFNEDYSDAYSDADFCLRVQEKGYRVACAGEVRLVVPSPDEGGPGAFEDRDRADFASRWNGYLSSRYRTRVMWHSWINAPTGYAVSSQYLVLALESLGVDVRYGFVYGVEEPANDDSRIMEVRRKPKDLDIPQVVYGQGDVFFKNSGKYRIGYSMLEVTGIPGNWAEQANALDEIWVPSRFNQETFSQSGVVRPIKVMPLGVDIHHFHPFIRSRRLDDRFVFLSVFEWGERKAPEILLKAFNQEFSKSDDAVLLLKVINTDPGVNIEQQVEALRLRPDGAPIVVVQNHDVPSYQMGSLYCSSDCFVLPTRGEGWGMPTLEAMACGLPVISTDWSAQTEFFNDQVGYPIRVRELIPAVAKCPYYTGYRWADPDPEHLASLMRYVYENREEARAKGLKASIAAREKWSWEKAAGRIRDRLLEVSGT